MKKIVVIPTYKESENISDLLRAILDLRIPELSILVVDDSSPDGTAAKVLEVAKQNPSVILAERTDDKGRGTAGIVGFDLAMQMGAEKIIEMDADFSHPPKYIPELLEILDTHDIAIASRLMIASKDNRAKTRKVVTRLSNLYARLVLERVGHVSRVSDWTSGFRGYRRSVFENIPTFMLVSRGPSILQEILYRAFNFGMKAKEIPFEMPDRVKGKSSFNWKVALNSVFCILSYGFLWKNKEKEFFLGGFEAFSKGKSHYQVRRTCEKYEQFNRAKIKLHEAN